MEVILFIIIIIMFIGQSSWYSVWLSDCGRSLYYILVIDIVFYSVCDIVVYTCSIGIDMFTLVRNWLNTYM